MDLDQKLNAIINCDLEEDVFGDAPLVQPSEKVEENFSESLEDLTASSIETIIHQFGIPPEKISPDEKIEAVRQLNGKGVFLSRAK